MSEAEGNNLRPKDGLKPYTLGEILDRTVQIYRRNFWLFAGIAALPTLLLILVGGGAGATLGWIGQSQPSTASIFAGVFVFLLILIFFPAYLVIEAMANGALTFAAVQMHTGEKVTIRSALSATWKRGWRFIGTQFLFLLFTAILPGIVFWGIIMLVVVLTTLSGAGSIGSEAVSVIMAVLVVIGALAFLIYLALSMIRLSLSYAACTAESLGPWQSLRRSFALTRGSMGRIFLFGLLVYALTMAITMVFVLIFMIPFFIVVALSKAQGTHAQQQVVLVAFMVCYYSAIFLAQVCVKPVYSIGLTVFYFDERVRKEGYDIEWMMQRAGLVADASSTSEYAAELPAGGEI